MPRTLLTLDEKHRARTRALYEVEYRKNLRELVPGSWEWEQPDRQCKALEGIADALERLFPYLEEIRRQLHEDFQRLPSRRDLAAIGIATGVFAASVPDRVHFDWEAIRLDADALLAELDKTAEMEEVG